MWKLNRIYITPKFGGAHIRSERERKHLFIVTMSENQQPEKNRNENGKQIQFAYFMFVDSELAWCIK
jgi:hypothetical protein